MYDTVLGKTGQEKNKNCKSGKIHPFKNGYEINPLYQSTRLRQSLMEEADRMPLPYIHRDKYNIFYACIKAEDYYFLIGPMAAEYLNHVRRHEYRKYMGIEL